MFRKAKEAAGGKDGRWDRRAEEKTESNTDGATGRERN